MSEPELTSKIADMAAILDILGYNNLECLDRSSLNWIRTIYGSNVINKLIFKLIPKSNMATIAAILNRFAQQLLENGYTDHL